MAWEIINFEPVYLDDEDERYRDYKNELRIEERKQAICDALCETLRLTTNAGTGNALKELRYLSEPDTVRPIFEDGTGEDGYYDINVAMDSGTAMIVDIVNQFVKKMW